MTTERFVEGIPYDIYPFSEDEIQKLVEDSLAVSATGELAATWGHIKSR